MHIGDVMPIVIGSVLTLVILGGVIFEYLWETRHWNKGTCRDCGCPWESFDQDSQGGRGYECKNGHSIWVTWPGVDRQCD